MFDFDDLPLSPHGSAAASRRSIASDATDDSWRCLQCGNSTFMWTGEGWKCADCRSADYHRVSQPVRHETEDGVWVFMPRQSSASQALHPPDDVHFEHPSREQFVDGHLGFGPSKPPSSLPEGRERGESEAGTEDPIVDPDTLSPQGAQRRRNRRSRKRAQYNAAAVDDATTAAVGGTGIDIEQQLPSQEQLPTGQSAGLTRSINNLVRALQNVVDSKGSDHSDSKSWNSRLGPKRGVKYRSGAPPNPPAWRYSRDDLRSFPKWQRKLAIWKKQILGFMSRRDAALFLYSSLTGEAEEELEHCDLERLDQSDGIEYIEQTLQSGLATKLVYQKRKLMADYESIVRQPSESLRAFANRYRRAEQALQSVSVDVRGMYDEESRGNRLLERSRLSPENQRLVLIGSGYNLSYSSICESLCMSFPEHKPPAQLFGKDGQPIKSRQFGSQGSSASSSSASTTTSSSFTKGKGKGKGKAKHAFVTAHDDAAALHSIAEDGDDEEELIPDQDGQELADEEMFEDPEDPEEPQELEDADPESLAQVLTVTARKLQSMTLGRRFSGTKSIEERKKTSTCSACGLQGHWAGDAEGAASRKGRGDSKGIGKKGKPSPMPSSSQSKKVLFSTVYRDDGSTTHNSVPPQVEQPPFFTFVTFCSAFEVLLNNDALAGLAGLMIIDTACQRMCCGQSWLHSHQQLLAQRRLCCKTITAPEAFQFGAGDPITAKDRVYIPVCLDGHYMLVGASSVAANIPLLASNTFLESMHAVIDCASSTIQFKAIDVSMQLKKVNGNLAVCIADFRSRVHELDVWKQLSHEKFWHDPHPEVISLHPRLQQHSRPEDSAPRSSRTDAFSSSPMDSGMEEDCPISHEHRVHHLQVDVKDGQTGHGTSLLAHTSRDQSAEGARYAHGQDEERAPQDAHGLQPSRMETARQQARVVCDVHTVPLPSEVDSGKAGMGGIGWLVCVSKIFFAAALRFKYLGEGLFLPASGSRSFEQVQDQAQAGTTFTCASSSTTDLNLFSDGFESAFSELGGDLLRPGRRHLGPGHDNERSERPQSGGGRIRLDLDRTPEPHGRDGQRWNTRIPVLKHSNDTGHRKQLLGKIRKARHAAEIENDLYEALATTHRTKRTRVDILETFAGRGMISKRASAHGLTACQPMDYNTGYDLAQAEHQAYIRRCVKHYEPLVLIEELHCAPWILMQDNINYRQNPEALQARRDQERPVLQEAMEWCKMQHQAGRYYLLENPLTSRLWDEPSVKSMLEETNGFLSTCHSGAYGGVNSKGQLIKKAFRFASNSKDLLSFLDHKLTAAELEQCTPLEGKEVTLSQEYPPGLVTSILRGIRYVAKMRNPALFQIKTVYAAFSQPSSDQQAWKQVIDQARRLFTSSSTSNIMLGKHDLLYSQTQALLPWEITRLQLAYRPLVQRLPQHVPHTHRGQVLKYTTRQELDITAEDLSDVHFPRGRFSAPVDIAVFFYGYPRNADEDLGVPGEEAAERDQEPEPVQGRENPTKEIFHDEITFPGTPGIDRSIKAAVARMHKNMGHLPPGELIKLLSLNGVTSDQVIKATKSMQCSACLRSNPPGRPNPAAPPKYLGQFADHLPADIFYCRDIRSTNYPILGIICEATHYHAAIRLESRNPEHVAQAFKTAWVRNFGFPLRLTVDDDGAFKSHFQEYFDEGGTFVDFIAPEAHHQLGVIERHNGTLRMLLERIVDATPCSRHRLGTSCQECCYLELRSSAIHRSLRQDPKDWPRFHQRSKSFGFRFNHFRSSTTIGHDEMRSHEGPCRSISLFSPEESFVEKDEFCRCHRGPKTRITFGILEMDYPVTSETYLGSDPSGDLWVQSGANTVKVSQGQARNVFGYENYIPTKEDVRALKTAEKNMPMISGKITKSQKALRLHRLRQKTSSSRMQTSPRWMCLNKTIHRPKLPNHWFYLSATGQVHHHQPCMIRMSPRVHRQSSTCSRTFVRLKMFLDHLRQNKP